MDEWFYKTYGFELLGKEIFELNGEIFRLVEYHRNNNIFAYHQYLNEICQRNGMCCSRIVQSKNGSYLNEYSLKWYYLIKGTNDYLSFDSYNQLLNMTRMPTLTSLKDVHRLYRNRIKKIENDCIASIDLCTFTEENKANMYIALTNAENACKYLEMNTNGWLANSIAHNRLSSLNIMDVFYPEEYMLTTPIRDYVALIKNHIIRKNQFEEIVNQMSYDEGLYLMARLLYPYDVFDAMEDAGNMIEKYDEELKFLNDYVEIVQQRFQLP